MGTIARHGDRRRRPASRVRAARRLRRGHGLPAVPRRRAGGVLRHAPRSSRGRAHRRAPGGPQPADARDPRRALRAPRKRACRCRGSSRRPRVSARATSPPATSSRSSTGRRPEGLCRATVRACSASATRWRSRRPTSTCGPPAPTRVRGHSIGGFGSVTTNKLVATLCGELFGNRSRPIRATARRRRACRRPTTSPSRTRRSACTRSWHRSSSCRVHDVSAFSLGDPLAGLVDGGTVFLTVRLPDGRGRSGPPSRRRRAGDRGAQHPGHRARHGRAGPPACATARPRGPDAGRRARGRVPPRGAVRRSRRAWTATALRGGARRSRPRSSASAAERSSMPTSQLITRGLRLPHRRHRGDRCVLPAATAATDPSPRRSGCWRGVRDGRLAP